jgi:hypothetical protein
MVPYGYFVFKVVQGFHDILQNEQLDKRAKAKGLFNPSSFCPR